MSSPKISEAFETVFENSPERKKRSAIIILESSISIFDSKDRELRKAFHDANASNQLRSRNEEVFANVMEGYLNHKSAQELAENRGLRKHLLGTGVLPLATVDVSRASIEALARQKGVVAILPNQDVELISPIPSQGDALTKEEKQCGLTWALKHLRIKEFWQQAGTKGQGIKVAVIDTGVHGDLPILFERVSDYTVIDPSGQRLTFKDGRTSDFNRHGTHVCGSIAGGQTSEGVCIGTAPDVKLAVANIPFGERSHLSTILDGIDWAVSVGSDVINMSFGMSYYDEKIDDLFKLLVDREIAPIVAIGNNSHGSTSCPGNAASVLGVGALEKSSRGVDVSFFSGGASIDRPHVDIKPRIVKPDLVAPGDRIYSCVPPSPGAEGQEFRLMSGTSMAAPHVSGIVAILMAACPQKSVTEIFDALRQTASHPGGSERRPDNRWGYGQINPVKALGKLRESLESENE